MPFLFLFLLPRSMRYILSCILLLFPPFLNAKLRNLISSSNVNDGSNLARLIGLDVTIQNPLGVPGICAVPQMVLHTSLQHPPIPTNFPISQKTLVNTSLQLRRAALTRLSLSAFTEPTCTDSMFMSPFHNPVEFSVNFTYISARMDPTCTWNFIVCWKSRLPCCLALGK